MELSGSGLHLKHVPLEILAEILKYVQEKQRFYVKLTSWKFYQAYLLLPSVSALSLVETVLNGEIPSRLFISTCDNYHVMTSICATVESEVFSRIHQDVTIPVATRGQYAILLSIADEIDKKVSTPYYGVFLKKMHKESRSAWDFLSFLERSITDALILNHDNQSIPNVMLIEILKYVPGPFIKSLIPGYMREAQVSYSLSCFNLAAARWLVKDYVQNEYSGCRFATVFQRHFRATLSCLFYPLHDTNKALLDKYMRRCTSETLLVKIVKEALLSQELPLHDWENQIICWLLLLNEADTHGIDLLLSSPRLDLVQSDFAPLRLAYQFLQRAYKEATVYAIQKLLDDPCINYEEIGRPIYPYIGEYGNIRHLEKFRKLTEFDPERLFYFATQTGNVELLQQLVRSISDSKFECYLHRAVRCNSIKSLEFLFANLPKPTNISAVGHELLLYTIYAHSSVLSWLLEQPFIDPTHNDNEAIVRASHDMPIYATTMDILLKDKRVDPSARNNEPFKSVFRKVYSRSYDRPDYQASYRKNRDIVACRLNVGVVRIGRLLLQDKRVTEKLAQMYPERENYGLSQSVFMLTDSQISSSPFCEYYYE